MITDHGNALEEAADIAARMLPGYDVKYAWAHSVEVHISPTLNVYFGDDLDTITASAEFYDENGLVDQSMESGFDSGLPWDSSAVEIARAIVRGVKTWAVKLEEGR
jgi:hypothetical protein